MKLNFEGIKFATSRLTIAAKFQVFLKMGLSGRWLLHIMLSFFPSKSLCLIKQINIDSFQHFSAYGNLKK